MNYKFELKQGFRIGELVIRMYENELKMQLFDPSELDKLTHNDKNYDTRKRLAKQRLLDQVEGIHVFFEEIELINGRGKKVIGLVDEEGLYQILMFINTPESRKIRESFAKILVEYRKRLKFEIYDFINQCEKQTIKIGSHINQKLEDIITSEYSELKKITDDIFIHNVLTFPTYNGNVIKDENDDEYIENIEKSDVESKIDYLINLDKVISLLVDVFGMDSKIMIEIIFDTVNVYEKNGKFYIDGNKDLMKIIFTLLCSELGEQTEKIREESLKILKMILGKISKGKKAFKSLFKSSTIFRNIISCFPYEKQESYNERYSKLRRKGLGKEEADQIAKETIKDGYSHIIVDEDLHGSTIEQAYYKIKRIR